MLEVLACKYVDEVIIGAPYVLTADLIKTLNVSKVVSFDTDEDRVLPEHAGADPFKVPREHGILVKMSRPDNDLTLEMIAQRVLD